jgi:DNA-directed RNA polymerase specialized sigma24 family protein
MDTGIGHADREIAARRNSTPGAVRVRLSRLRLKLAA